MTLMTNPTAITERSRYQVQTRNGDTWEHADMSDDLATAQRALRDARRWGYAARLVDTTTETVVAS